MVLFVSVICRAEEKVYTSDTDIANTLKKISFTDVMLQPADYWASKAIYVMASVGAIKGFEGVFDMKSTVKNDEVLAVLFRCANMETQAETLKQTVTDFKNQNRGVYNDIDSWADGYMRLAVDKGLITVNEFLSTMEIQYLTNPNPFFRKDGEALRNSLAKWMVIVFGLEKATKENQIIDFVDYGSIKEEDKLYLETAVNYGILKGSDGYLNPYGTLTREEMAQMFFNIYPYWAKAGNFDVITDTVSDITVDTEKNQNGTKLNNIRTISLGDIKVKTKITYDLNGEVVDSNVYGYNEYQDFPVIRDNQLPTDSMSLVKGETVVLLAQNGKVLCGFTEKKEENKGVLSTDGYEDSEVYSGKLYYYDYADKTIVIENDKGEYIEIPLFPEAEFYVRENTAEIDDINTLYIDKNVYVFTVKKAGIPTNRGYRIQIMQ